MWIWIILALLYVLSRIDLIPDVFVGWGWIDDIVVLVLLYRYLRRLGGPRRQQQQTDDTEPGRQQGTATAAAPKDPYTILGLSPGASAEDIRKAYHRLANQYHPDKVTHLGEEFQKLAEKRFKEIQQAYQDLAGKQKQP